MNINTTVFNWDRYCTLASAVVLIDCLQDSHVYSIKQRLGISYIFKQLSPAISTLRGRQCKHLFRELIEKETGLSDKREHIMLSWAKTL
jgi:hypothetical protein